MTNQSQPARERILDAANRLFYAEGIRAVSVDAIAEAAGTTKRTIYYHFKSKDLLIEAYLTSRDQPNIALYNKWYTQTEGSVAAKVEAIFQNVAKAARHPKWKGCGFLRTAAELANMPGHPAMKVGAAHKKRFEALLSEKFKDAGISAHVSLARHIVLLMDGAFSSILVHREPQYIEAAGEAAKSLVLNTR